MSSSQANLQPVVGSQVENTVNNTNTLSVSKNPSDDKPDKFNETDFKRWQQKMLFYLTTMNLANITREDVPKATTDPPTREMLLTIEAWMQSDFLCRNYILNRQGNNLYDIYSSYKTAKEVWEMLEKKYKTEDAGAKKFVIGKFLKYNMDDTKTVIKQVEEIQVLIHELHAEGCAISEQFQVGSIIEKLPPSWRDFKVYLKHKRREMTMEDLILRLRVEEDHRKGDSVDGARANVIESEPSTKQKFQKFKGKKMSKLKQKGKDFKKIKGSCWVCGKVGHKAQECRHRKDQTVTRTNQYIYKSKDGPWALEPMGRGL